MNEQEWIEKLEALGLLVQQTVRHLIQQRPDRSEQEAQLREVSRTVERLEKMGLSVPEELRRLKTNLVVQTDQDTDFDRQLRTLGESLVEALGMIIKCNQQATLERKYSEGINAAPTRDNARLVSSPL